MADSPVPLYGLIGYPLSHSFSPAYFTDKFRREGIAARYTAFPLEDIDAFPALLRSHPQLRGLNVTTPYKTAVIPFLGALSPDARAIGAVNCILIEKEGRIGFNTDWAAFRDSLRPLLQHWHRQALVLGTGGAAKAVVYALRQMGIPFRTASRSSDGFSLPYSQVGPELLADTHLIINTTPLGMYPDEDRAPDIPYAALTDRHLLFDLIYNPAETKFLALGKAQGAVIKNGLEMLHLQAEGSWEIWEGR